MKTVKYAAYLAALLLSVTLTACQVAPPTRPPGLPWQTLEQTTVPGVVEVARSQPALLVITRPEEVREPADADLARLLEITGPNQLAEQLQAVDYEQQFVLVAARSVGCISYYYVTDILSVVREGAQVTVRTQLQDDHSGVPCAAEASTAYHAVAVTREGAWDQEMTFVLEVDGQEVSRQSVYIP